MKRFFVFFIPLFMMTILFFSGVSIHADDRIPSDMAFLLDKEPLHPENTGYKALDQEIENLLTQFRQEGAITTSDLVWKAYNYLMDSVSYPGWEALPKDYPVRPIPANWQEQTKTKLSGHYPFLAYNVLFKRQGQCDEYSAAYIAILRKIGLQAMMVGGQYVRDSGIIDPHYWVVVKLSGNYYVFDPEVDDVITLSIGKKSFRYFGRPVVEVAHQYQLMDLQKNLLTIEEYPDELDSEMYLVNQGLLTSYSSVYQQKSYQEMAQKAGFSGLKVEKNLPQVVVKNSIPIEEIKSYAPLSEEIKVIVNHKRVHSDVVPEVQQGRVLLPLRSICEALGAQVNWDPKEEEAHILCRGSYLRFRLNSTVYNKGTSINPLEIPLQVKEGRIMVPVRALAEALDGEVLWYNNTRTATITV